MSVWGSIRRIALDGRDFPVAADGESDRNLGGYENEVEMNGDSSVRLIKKVVSAAIDSIPIAIDDSRNDQEYLKDLESLSGLFGCEVEYASGAIYGGQVQIVGGIKVGSMKGTAEISLNGAELKRI
ncbi:hypothetical protein P3521_03770 [Vibrio parahaemolyticus]|uniref:hypothetical protein n=1 Tax=Vibrio parahaemolyticus TaxID=670 RepID=UPI00226B3A84|nr:hypothetical protein [Vibrio parahaemolyticus]MCX8816967.1 hypothetical protein [Vibrio parahaemolyticus]MDF4579379.1 hypothetical protein [Vibrio parahaemolyticus]MDF4668720.1 hypothetical protein [Vibrio parahaemolyticus]HAV1412731.1 hypothetical protein [Vibrio parahaemolyticus]HAV2004813.1 hypothetical protein [Vibrio parahaemolyticus]